MPYFFLNDPLNNNKATVKKYDGVNWVDVGGVTISSTSSPILEMTLGNDGLPFVIYKEGSEIMAKKFDGTTWISIPTADLQDLTGVTLKIDHNGVPIVLYTYDAPYATSVVRKFNGSDWVEVGITGFQGKSSALCIDSNNQLYVVSGVNLRKFDGTSWQLISPPPFFGYYANLAVDTENNIYSSYANSTATLKGISKLSNGTWQVLFSETSYGEFTMAIDGNNIYEQHKENSRYPVVTKLTGTTWEILGDVCDFPINYYGASKYHDLTISGEHPIISYGDNFSRLRVKEFTGGNWNDISGTPISEQSIVNSKIETDTNGNTYVAYLNEIVRSPVISRLTVKKRNGTSWELIGAPNFSSDAEMKMDFKLNHSNVPYVVYKSGRVQKYNGTSWEFVGGSIYNGDKDVRLTFDTNDKPYVIYSGLYVKSYNGTAWEEVGTASLSAYTGAICPRIVCDVNNNIFIAFIDSLRKIHVLQWNGGSWQALGNEIETNVDLPSYYSFLTLTLDQNNRPCVMFNRKGVDFGNRANVYRYNGASWESIGPPDFSPASVIDGNLSFTSNNIPLVSYNSGSGVYCKYFGEANDLLSTANYNFTQQNGIIISPNPVTSTFSIKSTERIETIAIFDLTGRRVFSNAGSSEVDISGLPHGLYMIKVKTEKDVYSEKIFKK